MLARSHTLGSKRYLALIATAAVAWTGLCCGGRTDDLLPYELDLPAEGWAIDSAGKAPALEQMVCPDVTRRGWLLEPTESLSLDRSRVGREITLDGSAEIRLEGCSAGPADGGSRLRWLDSEGKTLESLDLTFPVGETVRRTVPWPENAWTLSIEGHEGAEGVLLQEWVISAQASAARTSGAQPSAENLKDRGAGPKTFKNHPPQILLISIDTWRADAIGALGGGADTPNLDALIAEAQVWSPHYAAASWTQPSHATLLTGQPTPVHGLENPRDSIHPGIPTLAQRLSAAGLPTAARAHDCVWLDPRFGFGRGFDDYGVRDWAMPKMAREVANWMVDRRESPFFFFFHTFEPHSDFTTLPYEAPGWSVDHVGETFQLREPGCRDDVCASALLEKMAKDEIAPTDAEIAAIRELYRRGVEHTDEVLGRLFDRLKAYGMWDSLTLVVTSDHGESLGAEGRLAHQYVWQDVLQVPLIIKWPGGDFAGEIKQIPTSSIDIAPTLLASVGAEHGDLPGTDLRIKRRATPIFAGTVERVVISGGWKGIFQIHHEPKIYDLSRDPLELDNVAESMPEKAAELEDTIRRWFESLHPVIEQRDRRAGDLERIEELTPEEIERLRSLGYLGS